VSTEKYIIGIDIGGTTIKAGITDLEGKILSEKKVITSKAGAEHVVESIKTVISELMFDVEASRDDVMGIGVGVPGPTNTDTGIVFSCANIPGFEQYPLQKRLEEETKMTVRIGNDVNCGTMGEAWLGSGIGYKNILGIFLGTGIGGGIIIDGKLVSGANGAAAEVGHMKIKSSGELYGKLCGCGQYGCWEAYCSSVALEREARMRMEVNNSTMLWDVCGGDITKVTAKDIFECAKQGDKFALLLVDYELNYLAKGIANIANILNPEIIIIGGGMSLAGDILFDGLRDRMQKYTMAAIYENLKIIPSKLGNESGIVGACALLMMHNV